MPSVFSIREPLQGALHDYVQYSGFSCVHTENLIRDLVCLIASYREEGVQMFPTVFVVDSLPVMASIAPGVQRLTLGSIEFGSGVARKILKDCASLASSGWSIYIVRRERKRVEYGLFRSQRHSFATSAEETLKDLGNKSPVIVIRNLGHLIVELNNSQRHDFTVSFTSEKAAKSPLSIHVDEFCGIMASMINADLRADFCSYSIRILTERLQYCHGALLAAIDTPEFNVKPDTLEDGVWFDQPLDWCGKHTLACSFKDADTLSDLQAVETLLGGMLNSDGVTLFGTDGKVLAYRVFLKPTDEEKLVLPDAGGGRRRTYELMKSRVGGKLKGAFFRSQDGATDCKGIMA